MNPFLRILYILLGFLCLFLGALGIIVPGLPTTPFVLLSAALFLRSSESLYQKLKSNPVFGKYLRNYMEKKGMTLKSKVVSISIMWVMITLSFLNVPHIHFRIFIVILGISGTVVMGFVVKTVHDSDPDDSLSTDEAAFDKTSQNLYILNDDFPDT